MGNYDNILLIGDFNSQMELEKMKEFCESYNLENLIRDPTCYKNVLNPTSIDMILTNRANLFTNSCCIETGISQDDNNSFNSIPQKIEAHKNKI